MVFFKWIGDGEVCSRSVTFVLLIELFSFIFAFSISVLTFSGRRVCSLPGINYVLSTAGIAQWRLESIADCPMWFRNCELWTLHCDFEPVTCIYWQWQWDVRTVNWTVQFHSCILNQCNTFSESKVCSFCFLWWLVTVKFARVTGICSQWVGDDGVSFYFCFSKVMQSVWRSINYVLSMAGIAQWRLESIANCPVLFRNCEL